MALETILHQLAEATRKRFKVNEELSLQDMVKIINPPVLQRNLIPGSDNFDGYPGGGWVAFNNLGSSGSWNGLLIMSLNVDGLVGYKNTFNPGIYTFSVFAKLANPDDSTTAVIKFQGDTADAGKIIRGGLTTDWQRFVYTTTFTKQVTGRFQISLTSANGVNRLLIAGEKVEQGDIVTPYITIGNKEVTAPIYSGGAVRYLLKYLYNLVLKGGVS